MIRRWLSTTTIARRGGGYKSKPSARLRLKDLPVDEWSNPKNVDLRYARPPSPLLSRAHRELSAKIEKEDPSIQLKLHPLDISHPWRLYPQARKLRRKVILHVGPTNSGKSYAALQAFRAAKSGFYAGPLRMLAREVYDRLDSEGVPCNLITGDEVLEKIDEATGKPVRLSAGTVEMVDVTQHLEVAVIDEIQMIDDPDRGWAWTRAVLGVRADEVHLCGDANSETVVRALMEQTGDDLEVRRYERLSPLALDARDIKASALVASLEQGDCVVCFSKRKVKEMRDLIVKNRREKCAIIYGSLPPETRAEQAKLFNTPGNSWDFLVASDAIGMGLNLAIRRIIFTTLKKFNGERIVTLPITQIKQIAGRAGRFRLSDNSEGSGEGLVNTTNAADKKIVQGALRTPSPLIEHAVNHPPTRVINASSVDKAYMFSRTLKAVYQQALVGSPYVRPRENNAVMVSKCYDHVYGLTFEDKLVLANAPVTNTVECITIFTRYCEVIGSGRVTNVADICRNIEQLGKPSVTTMTLENIHKAITLFLWLSYRFPCNFVDREGATALKELCEARLNESLASKRALERPQKTQKTQKRRHRR